MGVKQTCAKDIQIGDKLVGIDYKVTDVDLSDRFVRIEYAHGPFGGNQDGYHAMYTPLDLVLLVACAHKNLNRTLENDGVIYIKCANCDAQWSVTAAKIVAWLEEK